MKFLGGAVPSFGGRCSILWLHLASQTLLSMHPSVERQYTQVGISLAGDAFLVESEVTAKKGLDGRQQLRQNPSEACEPPFGGF